MQHSRQAATRTGQREPDSELGADRDTGHRETAFVAQPLDRPGDHQQRTDHHREGESPQPEQIALGEHHPGQTGQQAEDADDASARGEAAPGLHDQMLRGSATVAAAAVTASAPERPASRAAEVSSTRCESTEASSACTSSGVT